MWSLVANFTIAYIEYLNRVVQFATFGHALRVTWPLILVAQCGLFYAWRGAPALMVAWMVFFIGNVTLRLGTTWAAGEPPNLQVAAGLALVVAGALTIKGA